MLHAAYRHRLHVGAVLLVGPCLVMVTTSCGSSSPSASIQPRGFARGELRVSDAASLTDAYEEIANGFEAEHPGVTVTLNPDSSAKLAEQILAGAPADVFASADELNMAKLTKAGETAATPKVFARNRLAIVTKPANPAKITTLTDLASAGVISLCGEDAPCGRYAAEALKRAKVTIDESKVTRGQNVKATLTAVSEGDAVAGIVYVTDARAAAKAVATVDIPAADNAVARYPIAVLKSARKPAIARAFVAFVQSTKGQRIMARYGFLPPP